MASEVQGHLIFRLLLTWLTDLTKKAGRLRRCLPLKPIAYRFKTQTTDQLLLNESVVFEGGILLDVASIHKATDSLKPKINTDEPK